MHISPLGFPSVPYSVVVQGFPASSGLGLAALASLLAIGAWWRMRARRA